MMKSMRESAASETCVIQAGDNPAPLATRLIGRVTGFENGKVLVQWDDAETSVPEDAGEIVVLSIWPPREPHSSEA